jgi:hypothetical protein
MRGSTIMMSLLLAIATMSTLAPLMPHQPKLASQFKPKFTDLRYPKFTTA